MVIEQGNPDRRKFLYYAGFLSLALGLAAVFDRYLLHNQDAPDSTVSSVTLYSIFVFLGLMSAMLFSGEEGNGFYYLCCGCDCPGLFKPTASDSDGVGMPPTLSTPLRASSGTNYGTAGSIN